MSVQQQWPAASRRARADLAAIKMMSACLFAFLGYIALTNAALGPAGGPVVLPVIAAPSPTIAFKDGAPVIVGSVASLFQTVGTFVGPNEAMKQDRLLPNVDVLSLTKSFDAERTRIASLESGDTKGVLPVSAATVVADTTIPLTSHAEATRLAIAAADPSRVASSPDSAALNAIDSVSAPPTSAAPMPGTLSQQLAYAREDAPITTFPNYAVSDQYSSRDLNCLAQAIYFEARGEPYRGQVAVAQVVMNRLAHPLYPKSICGVVFQDSTHHNACQFSFACDGQPEVIREPEPWKQAQEIAEKVADGELYLPEVGNATHYHAAYVYPDWAPEMKRVTRIGLHIFYKFRNAA